ncbi:DUF5131 family protein [bacterium]|nr:DUF5131 family protein [bacterium]
MAISTSIQWCDSTCNPTMGCDGCELWNEATGERTCYAGVLHSRYGGKTKGYSPTFDQLTFWPGRMAAAAKWADLKGTARPDKPWLDGLPRLIFVSDMSDALSKTVSFDYLRQEIIETVESPNGQRHCWLWLTKRPSRMAALSEHLAAQGVQWPSNLWAGTSITSQKTLRRADELLRVGQDSTIRFLSVEPQREKIVFSDALPRVDWVIQGGESGRTARPFDLSWATCLRDQCRAAGTAYFLKQLGSHVLRGSERIRFKDSHAGNWSEWPDEVKAREMPKSIPVPPVIAPIATRTEQEEKGGVQIVAERVPLEVVPVGSKARRAALKAWETRRRNQQDHKGACLPHSTGVGM